MPGNDTWFEPSDDGLRDSEFPDDEFDDEISETVPCPQCGADVYEDAVQCPACGTYITHEANVWSGRPAWWIVLGLLGILAVILTLAGALLW
ncbi:MAG: zinc-ribbon domain-containing protein [Pirellulales bacterium]|nr:zinc-ribbon domain-containing protein [Pirellulales bacterium]